METDRRHFLRMLAAGLLLPASGVLASSGTESSGTEPRLLISAASDRKGHWLLVTDDAGNTHMRHPLPSRAHHVELHPKRPWVAVAARRPGDFIEVVDYRAKRPIKRILVDDGYLFNGHLVFSRTGAG